MANLYNSREDGFSSTDRDGSSADEGKRKREERKEEQNSTQIFKRSKKIQRTPVKTLKPRENREDNMDEIKEMMQAMMTEVQVLRKGQENFCQEVRILREQNQNMIEEMKLLRQRVALLEAKEIEDEKEKRRKRKNNILITGLEIPDKEESQVKGKIQEFLLQKVDVKAEIRKAYKVKEQMFVAQLESFEKKMEIMNKKKKLKELKSGVVFINDDLTQRERGIQKKIRERAMVERQQKRNAKVGYMKLTVNGVIWRWNNESGQLEQKN